MRVIFIMFVIIIIIIIIIIIVVINKLVEAFQKVLCGMLLSWSLGILTLNPILVIFAFYMVLITLSPNQERESILINNCTSFLLSPQKTLKFEAFWLFIKYYYFSTRKKKKHLKKKQAKKKNNRNM
uniref:Uncharacterized protein n=1 Tax=Octopus bimaculoides TaxID=37653 RepID=A0A0L8I5E3_OCTBM